MTIALSIGLECRQRKIHPARITAGWIRYSRKGLRCVRRTRPQRLDDATDRLIILLLRAIVSWNVVFSLEIFSTLGSRYCSALLPGTSFERLLDALQLSEGEQLGARQMDRVATGFGLIEGPVWDPARGLYFSDVINGGVYLRDLGGKVTRVVPKRRGIGGMAIHAEGGLVVGGRDIAHIANGVICVLLALDAIPGATGFNDLTTDRAGRVYVGSLAFHVFGGDEPRPGHLHIIDLDGTMRTISDGVMLTSGLAFSPDGLRLYHCDAQAALVRVYDVNVDGTVKPWRTFASLGSTGVPDGMKVASDGSVWVADAHGGRVVVFDASGVLRRNIPVPLPMVTTLCFGGDDLCDLYIVTGSRGGPHDNSGTIFRMRVDVAGLPLPPARVAIGGSALRQAAPLPSFATGKRLVPRRSTKRGRPIVPELPRSSAAVGERHGVHGKQ